MHEQIWVNAHKYLRMDKILLLPIHISEDLTILFLLLQSDCETFINTEIELCHP